MIKNTPMEIYIGTSGWTFNDWRGAFYPEKLAKSKWFNYYSQLFNAIEINATFYRRFEQSTYEKWYNNAPEGFKYILKAPQTITHRKYLKNCLPEAEAFVSSALHLKEKLGGVLLQLHPNTKYNPEILDEVLKNFNLPGMVTVEFRNEKWLTEETTAVLTEHKAIGCNCQSPKLTKLDWITYETAYFRLHGRDKWYDYDYTDEELNEFAEIIKSFENNGVKKIFVFFNNDVNASSPRNAGSLKRIIHP